VSLSSGQAVAAALKARGHVVYESDIGPDDLAVLDRIHVDVVFPVLHGTFGEDGQLQAILEERGLRYVGSNAASSRLAMDKWLSKQAVEVAGVLTAEGVLLCGHSDLSGQQNWGGDRPDEAGGLGGYRKIPGGLWGLSGGEVYRRAGTDGGNTG